MTKSSPSIWHCVSSKCQINGEDFINFCGLLRRYELYSAYFSAKLSNWCQLKTMLFIYMTSRTPPCAEFFFLSIFFKEGKKNWLPIWLPARTTQKVFLRTHNGMISILKEQSYYCTYTFTLDLNLNTYMIELMFHK